jgi:hypothetical protein
VIGLILASAQGISDRRNKCPRPTPFLQRDDRGVPNRIQVPLSSGAASRLGIKVQDFHLREVEGEEFGQVRSIKSRGALTHVIEMRSPIERTEAGTGRFLRDPFP